MNRLSNIIMTCLFLGCIILVGFIMLLKPDRLNSEFENRKLEQRPVLNKYDLISGEYFKSYETYFSDQLFTRDLLIKAYTKLQLSMNKTIINSTVVAEDNWLMDIPTTSFKKSTFVKSIQQMNDLASYSTDNNISINLVLAPHKKNILENIYPKFIQKNVGSRSRDHFAKNIDSKVNYIDLAQHFQDTFTHEQLKEMYFRTDHHWNLRGAFNSYKYILTQLGDEIVKEELNRPILDYEVRCSNSANFLGSYNRKLFGLKDYNYEYLCGYFPNDQSHLQKFKAINSRGAEFNNINEVFGRSLDKAELSYAGITSSDFAEIKFHYSNISSINMLILKDSYANAIVPFLAQHFSSTSVIDLRHYHEMNVYKYIEENNINAILILYNDTNLSGELYSFDGT
ncbi:hypothetical protein JCM10914A_14700 [Paenibacillus sp. JCM 10914]|uniref:DHHW family protein n=1 Tax=Paenibacillus sp. JCM 10914 TaxID=1236974 RepID=UPI0003CC988D|nr:DHHW family protein [Paenibacillus sp. JCM 10914]GAE09681.1 hypothetical protein JCM10914_6056 [Paenibacillus sp. JCM 10914]